MPITKEDLNEFAAMVTRGLDELRGEMRAGFDQTATKTELVAIEDEMRRLANGQAELDERFTTAFDSLSERDAKREHAISGMERRVARVEDEVAILKMVR